MTIAEIVELHKSIEIARYALAHIRTKLECGDGDIADKALTKAVHIMNKLLGEVSRQKKLRRKWMLKWTSEPPKEIGWYWYRSEPEIAPSLVFVCWRYAPNQEPQWCAVLPCNCDVWLNANKLAGEWAGPIPEPVEPEE